MIGVNTLTYMAGQNLNFAVPIELVHELLAGRGQPLSVAEVFGQMQYDGTASNYFEHRPGELAVVLNWEGDVDLDLEIWTADFEFMEIAAILGDSPDIIKGGQGEEWFAFTTYTYLDDETTADYSEGRYMVAVYYYGPEPADEFGEVAASLDVFYPDGTRESLLMEHLWYGHPYNQWFALLVDAGTDTVKVLDFYLDSPLVALLEWDTEADLDLAIYSDRYDQPFMPGDFWYGYDFTAGSLGLEVFRFGHFSNDDDSFDFTKGRHDIFINMPNTGVPVTTATVTLLSDDYHITRFRRTFSPDPRGDYLWWVVYGLEPERFAYFEPEIDEAVIFLDQ